MSTSEVIVLLQQIIVSLALDQYSHSTEMKMNSGRNHEQEFGPENLKTVKKYSTKICGQEFGFAQTLYYE